MLASDKVESLGELYSGEETYNNKLSAALPKDAVNHLVCREDYQNMLTDVRESRANRQHVHQSVRRGERRRGEAY